MNDFQRNLLTAGLLCAASASLIGGIAVRQRVDEKSAGLKGAEAIAPGLVASRAPVDIPEERYFYELMVLLKREYVDPIRDEMVLANGAVKGMVSSLNDTRSLYMSKPLFHAYVNSIRGKYEGIGVSLRFARLGPVSKKIQTTADYLERVPLLVAAYVAPKSPAAYAGLRPGDEIEEIDGRWIVNPREAQRIRSISAKVKSGDLPQEAIFTLQKELREKMRDSMMPMRAFERLSTGSEGHLQLAWRRSGKRMEADLAKKPTDIAINAPLGGQMTVAFVEGAASALRKATGGATPLILDLRGATNGDLQVMQECLSALNASGPVGRIVKEDGDAATIKLPKAAGPAKKVRLLVDGQTAGVAEAFALALKARGQGVIQGGPMKGDTSIVERTALSDGSGFTLRVGKFVPAGGSK